jgi:hypothetical protein
VDDFREDDTSSEYKDIPVDSESESDDDNDSVDRNRNRNASAAINISPYSGNASNAVSSSSSSSSSKTGSGGGSYSFGGTKGVFEVLRVRMSLRPNRPETDSKSLGAAGRLGRTRSNSSGHLPGNGPPPGR